MKAVKRFDPAHGVRLVSLPCIGFGRKSTNSSCATGASSRWPPPRRSASCFQAAWFQKRLGWLNNEEVNTVARELGVSPDNVLEMESRLSGHDVSFDPAPEADGNDEIESYAPSAYLRDEQADPSETLEREDWEDQTVSRLGAALEQLDPRSRDIVQRRWLNDDKADPARTGCGIPGIGRRIRQWKPMP